MRTSLNEIRQIEGYLLKNAGVEDLLVTEAKYIIDVAFRQKVRDQQKVYRLVKLYGRKKLKEELENIHRKLLREPEHTSFRRKILQIFSKK